MEIKLLQDDPYGQLICGYFASHFNKAITPNSKQLLDTLTAIIVGDKNIRLGPSPDPEQLVVIRKTLSSAIELGAPIPILVAWGGRKTDPVKGVDVAEVAALYQLMRLDDNIKRYHPAGIHVHIRIEDTGAEWLYRTQRDDMPFLVDSYSTSFVNLTKALTKGYSIEPIRESWLMSHDQYFRTSEKYSELLEDVIEWKLLNRDLKGVIEGQKVKDAFDKLAESGWKGDLPMVQIDHYIERYKVLYPGLSLNHYILMASDYLGGAKARYDLNGRAEPDSAVGSFISISFIPPIPGAPASLFNNTLYYRTVPANQGRTHIAPWRAKGYLEINPDNSVNAKVTSWSNREIIGSLNSATISIKHEGEEILIDVDYLVRDFIMPMPMM